MKLDKDDPMYDLIENYLVTYIEMGNISNYVGWCFIDGNFNLYNNFTGEVYCEDIDSIVKYISKSNVRHDRNFYLWMKQREEQRRER